MEPLAEGKSSLQVLCIAVSFACSHRVSRFMRALPVWVIAGLVAFGATQEGPDDLEPYSVKSPSGEYRLWVNPSTPEGFGPADYELYLKGKRLWHKTLPLTLQEAGVTDRGNFGGYAYGTHQLREGNLLTALFSAGGVQTFKEIYQRRNAGRMHSYPQPNISQMLVVGDEMILVHHPPAQSARVEWWAYSPDTPGPRRKIEPDIGELWMIDSRKLPGLPLILSITRTGPRYGIAVNDATGRKIWTATLEGGYPIKPRGFDESGLILDATSKGFEILRWSSQERIRFEITKARGAWQVREIGRRPYKTPVPAKPAPITAPIKKLRVMRTLTLPLTKTKGADFGLIMDFLMIDRGRVAILSADNKLHVASMAGNLERTIALPAIASQMDRTITQTKPGTVLVFDSHQSLDHPTCRLYRIDCSTGKITAVPGFQCPPVSVASGRSDGCFAVLASEASEFSSRETLRFFGAEGKQRWQLGTGGYGGGDDEIFGSADVACDEKGQIWVLGNIRDSIQLFDDKSKFLKIFKFEKLGKDGLDYPTNFETNGKILALVDSPISPRLLVVGPDGSLLSEQIPSYPDLKKLKVLTDPRIDDKGQVWVTDGHAILRLDDKGLVAETLGKSLPTAGLTQVSDIHIASDGKVTVLDAGTIEAAMFSPSGKRLAHMLPLAKDFAERPAQSELLVTRSGDVYLTGGVGEQLHFSPSGKRMGWSDPYPRVPAPTNNLSPKWRWYRNRLLDEEGRTVVQLRRWPDYRWLNDFKVAIGPDSGYAVLGMPKEPANNPGVSGIVSIPVMRSTHLAFFKANGAPISMVKLSEPLVEVWDTAFDGTILYCLRRDRDIVAVARSGGILWRMPAKGVTHIAASLGGLAVFDGKSTVTWYSTK